MEKRFKFLMGMVSLMLLVVSCVKDDENLEMELEAVNSKASLVTTEGQLERLTQKMQRYHNFQVSVAQNFEAVSPYVPFMGIHYGQLERFDGTFELEKPEILLYVPDKDGNMTFVGVEYAVPVKFSPKPPEGFVGRNDKWEFNERVAPHLGGSWTLHAWVILDNPDGVFTKDNPNVPKGDPRDN